MERAEIYPRVASGLQVSAHPQVSSRHQRVLGNSGNGGPFTTKTKNWKRFRKNISYFKQQRVKQKKTEAGEGDAALVGLARKAPPSRCTELRCWVLPAERGRFTSLRCAGVLPGYFRAMSGGGQRLVRLPNET